MSLQTNATDKTNPSSQSSNAKKSGTQFANKYMNPLNGPSATVARSIPTFEKNIKNDNGNNTQQTTPEQRQQAATAYQQQNQPGHTDTVDERQKRDNPNRKPAEMSDLEKKAVDYQQNHTEHTQTVDERKAADKEFEKKNSKTNDSDGENDPRTWQEVMRDNITEGTGNKERVEAAKKGEVNERFATQDVTPEGVKKTEDPATHPVKAKDVGTGGETEPEKPF